MVQVSEVPHLQVLRAVLAGRSSVVNSCGDEGHSEHEQHDCCDNERCADVAACEFAVHSCWSLQTHVGDHRTEEQREIAERVEVGLQGVAALAAAVKTKRKAEEYRA